MPRRLLVALTGVIVAASGLLGADEPGIFAIRNARIVPVSGPVLDQGTIVVADGLIVAVGAAVTPPPEAWVIEGQGLTVYPGLIDAWTDLGLTAGAPAASPGPGAGGPPAAALPRPPPSRGPEDRPASTPWLQAADELKADDRRLETWRDAGFTAALSAPKAGLLPGQGAVIALGGARAGAMIVRSPATLQVSLQPPGGFGSFPGSLMGTVAYLRQVFLDATHDQAATRAYEAAQPGVSRPAYDRTVKALQQAQAARLPVLMPATTAGQIVRVLELSRELALMPVVVGGHEAGRVVDRLASAKVPVIVSLKWPERDANGDPEAVEPLRSLRLRAGAPATPAALEKAGVVFAFSSDGLAPRDLVKHVRRAIDAGLTAEGALRGLTLDAARLLGVANRLGSLEPGKAAHLVVTDGDLFADKTKVKMTFVDGMKFDVVDAPRPAPTEKPAGNVTGRWTLTVTTPNGVQTPIADLTQGSDGSLSGTLTSPMGVLPVTGGSISGATVSFGATLPMDGTMVGLAFSGTVEGSTMKGTMTAGTFSGEFTGTKAGPGGE